MASDMTYDESEGCLLVVLVSAVTLGHLLELVRTFVWWSMKVRLHFWSPWYLKELDLDPNAGTTVAVQKIYAPIVIFCWGLLESDGRF